MKHLHRADLFGWSAFDPDRDLDFNSVAWIRPDGNVVVDPMPLSAHDAEHLAGLGGVALVVITTSDHLRAGLEVAAQFGAELVAPVAEAATFPASPSRYVGDGDEVVPGLSVHELHGSKTPGELALVLEATTLITGDLVRGPRGGRLDLLPAGKLADPGAARASLQRLCEHAPAVETVLVGDGWHLWRGGAAALRALCS